MGASGRRWNQGRNGSTRGAGSPLPRSGGAASIGSGADLSSSAPEAILLASVYVAGFQYHHGMHPHVLRTLREGEALVPVRESGNPHDGWAIAVYTRVGARIGYLPRGVNEPIARMMDQGIPVSLVIQGVDPAAPSWERVRVLVWSDLSAQFWISMN